MPAHEAAFPLLRRTLECLNHQTTLQGGGAPVFEVVVAIDGPGRFNVPETNYPLAFVRTPRTDSPLPHRNHARNAAARVAQGKFLWFVDCDFLWDTHTVEHLLGARHAPLSPVLVSVRQTPAKWMEDQRWDAKPELSDYQNMLRTLTLQGMEWSGYARRYRTDKGVLVEEHEQMPEGFPMVRRDTFTGFDERFLGRGGNKESFVATLEDYRLLASARGYHQPHERGVQDPALTEYNRGLYEGSKNGVW